MSTAWNSNFSSMKFSVMNDNFQIAIIKFNSTYLSLNYRWVNLCLCVCVREELDFVKSFLIIHEYRIGERERERDKSWMLEKDEYLLYRLCYSKGIDHQTKDFKTYHSVTSLNYYVTQRFSLAKCQHSAITADKQIFFK